MNSYKSLFSGIIAAEASIKPRGMRFEPRAYKASSRPRNARSKVKTYEAGTCRVGSELANVRYQIAGIL